MNTCIHHWLCGAPDHNGAVAARCRDCGEARTFYPFESVDTASAQWAARARSANRKGQTRRRAVAA